MGRWREKARILCGVEATPKKKDTSTHGQGKPTQASRSFSFLPSGGGLGVVDGACLSLSASSPTSLFEDRIQRRLGLDPVQSRCGFIPMPFTRRQRPTIFPCPWVDVAALETPPSHRPCVVAALRPPTLGSPCAYPHGEASNQVLRAAAALARRAGRHPRCKATPTHPPARPIFLLPLLPVSHPPQRPTHPTRTAPPFSQP